MFEIELSLKIVSLPSQVVSVPFPTGGGWKAGIFIQPHNLHKTQPAAQNKLLSTPRGSHPKRGWSIGILSQPRGGPDRKNGQNKSGLVTVKTLPKALRTQALTALTSNFGLVGLVQYAWKAKFDLVW